MGKWRAGRCRDLEPGSFHPQAEGSDARPSATNAGNESEESTRIAGRADDRRFLAGEDVDAASPGVHHHQEAQ